MTNGEKFIEVFGVGCATYDVMHDITTIHRNGDWWDAEYECEENITDSEAARFLKKELEYMRSHGTDIAVEAYTKALDALKFKKKAGVVISQLRADRDRLATALDEIRAEIEQLRLHKAQFLTNDNKVCIDSQEVLEIIDKHRKGEE